MPNKNTGSPSFDLLGRAFALRISVRLMILGMLP